MKLILRGSSAAAACLLVSSAFAQDIEPNQTKASADANGATVLNAGGSITGTTTGTGVAAGDTLLTTVDTYRLRTGALPLGVYAHRLTITSATVGHTGTIRGLNQTGTIGVGGIPGTTDSTVQTSVTAPDRRNQWYAFGKQEEIYYRVSGAAATTAPYTATLSTQTITPGVVTQAFESANPITIQTVGQTTGDTEIFVYDAAFNVVGLNDDEFGGGTQSRVTFTGPAGTYFIGIGNFNTASSSPASAQDDFVTGILTDFPDNVVASSTSTLLLDHDFEVIGSNGSLPQPNQVPAGDPFRMSWWQITTSPGAPPIIVPPPANDNCANAISIGTGGTFGGTVNGASNDGAASCDPGGAASRDVWYSYTNTNASIRLLSASLCSATGVNDTVLTVYNGCGGTELGCNDDCGGTPCTGPSSCLSGLAVNPAQVVLIRVSDKGLGGPGNFNLLTSAIPVPPPAPPNDDCNTPIVLPGPGVYPFDTTAATTGSQGQGLTVPCGTTSSVKNDLWYTYTAGTNGSVTFSTCGLTTSVGTDTKLSYYAGAGCPVPASPIGCDDDACVTPTFNTILTFNVVCGEVYAMQLGNFSQGGATAGTFSVTETGTSCATPATPFCLGDGTGTPCPCSPVPNNGAPGHGCGSVMFPGGAILTNDGIASDETVSGPSADTLELIASSIPGPALFIQSNGIVSPIAFGDGQLCAAVSIIRLGVVFPGPPNNPPNVASYPGGLTPNEIHLQGFANSGDTKHYQAWYRSVPGVCTSGQNYDLTQGLSIVWGN